MKRLTCTTLAFFAAVSAFASGGMLSAGRGTPVIDGRLDETVWQSSSIAATPFLVQQSTRFAALQTEVRFLYDDDNLYVSFRCFTDVLEPINNKLHALKADFKKHDSDYFYKNDGVELLFDNPSAERIFDIAVSVSGSFCDATAPKSTADMWNKRDFTWESNAKIACHQNIENANGYWSSEIAIPWQSLGGKPALNSKWKMVAARFEQDGKERSAFQPIASGIHTMEAFGTLKFVQKVPGVALTQMPSFIPGDNTLCETQSPLELKAKINFGGKTENYRASLKKDGKLVFPLNGSGSFHFTWSINSRSTLQELFRSPEYSLAVISSSLSAKLTNAVLSINGTSAGEKVLLRSGNNLLLVKASENPVVELSSNGWKVPFPTGWKKGSNGEYTLNLFSGLTWVWPDWTLKGVFVTRGGIQQLLVLPSGIPDQKVSDYTILLDLPIGMKLLSASGFYNILPSITVSKPQTVHYFDTDFSRYAITINSERGFRREFAGHELLACLIATDKAFPADSTKICISVASVQAGAMEMPNVIPVYMLPELAGKQPKKYHVEMWSGWTGQMLDKKAFPSLMDFFASVGINEDSSLSGKGLNQFALINFKWSFSK